MAPKKIPSEQWFKLAPDVISKEHKTIKKETFVCEDDTIMRWSAKVVKSQQCKFILIMKVGEHNNFTWTIVTNWEVTLVHAMGDYIDIILKNLGF